MRPCLEAPTVEGDPLAHADEAMADGRLSARADAIVDHLELEPARVAPDCDNDRTGVSVFDDDLISHTVSVMGVQAGAAAEVLDSDPAGAREALGAIERSARESVLELRRLLDVLRERGEAPELAPQPGLGELEELVKQLRSTGLEVELDADAPSARLAPGIELAAYRIAQEALTNVEFAADPGPLLGHGGAHVGLACPLEPLGALLHLASSTLAPRVGAAGKPGRADDDRAEDEILRDGGVAPATTLVQTPAITSTSPPMALRRGR